VRNEFLAWRVGQIERRRQAGADDPGGSFDRQVHWFECERMPVVSLGRTETLVGEAYGGENVMLRTLERGPGRLGPVHLLPANRTNETRMVQFALGSMRRHLVQPQPTCCERSWRLLP
jgi:hypothetical protein